MKEIEKLFKTEFDYVEEFRFLARKLSKTFRSFPVFIMGGRFLLQLANCQPTPICLKGLPKSNCHTNLFNDESGDLHGTPQYRNKGRRRCIKLTKRVNMQNAEATWRLCALTYCLPGAIGFTSQG